MEQEAVLANLLKSDLSSGTSEFNMILTGQLPNQEQVYFQAHAIAEDNDCGFHALGLDRSKAVTQLLAHAKDENIRYLVVPEIKAAFLEGTLPKAMQDEEYQSLWQAYNAAWENYRQIIVDVKEEIRRSNEDYFSAIQSLTPDALITWLDAHADCAALKEQLINARLNSVFPAERKLDIYCEKEEIFKTFVTHYLGKGGWLTYIGNYQNKTQQTSSLDALAELNQLQVFIWQAAHAHSQQLQLVHHYGKLEHPVIHMLHTHGMTHYDLLQKMDKPTLAMTAAQIIPFGKQEEKEFPAISFPISQADHSYLNSLPTSSQPQTQPSEVIKIVTEIKQGQEKMEYALQAEAFIKLGDYYLNQKKYLYAAAIYNYVLNIYRLKLAGNNENEKTVQESNAYQAEQHKLINKLIEVEQQYIIKLRAELQKSPIDNPHPYLKADSRHRNYLQQLREDCKRQLAEIDQRYPFDIYDEDKAKGQEEKYQQLQLEKAKAVHDLYHEIAERLKEFIQKLIQECIEVLGEPPCEYAVMGLGSLAREEATPYSDLEFAILIAEEKEEYKQYFRNLTKLLHLKVVNLGETILPAMAIPALNNYYSNNPLDNWFYDDITPRGFAFDGAMPQACKTPLGKQDKNGIIIYELIHSPKMMAKFQGKMEKDLQNRSWFEIEQHLSNILTSNAWIIGNYRLVQIYNNEIKELLDVNDKNNNKMREKMALKLLKEDLNEFEPRIDYQIEEGKIYQVKKDIYRATTIIIDRLTLYFDLNEHHLSNNYWLKLEKLFEKGLINLNFKSNLQIASSISSEMRLKAYLSSNSQNETMSILYSSVDFIMDGNSKQKIKKIFNIPSVKMLYKFYYTVLPLYKTIEAYCAKNSNLIFSEENLYDNNFYTKALIMMRLCQYNKAKQFFAKANIENIKKNGYFHDSTASILNKMGLSYEYSGDINNALCCYQQAISIDRVLNLSDWDLSSEYLINFGIASTHFNPELAIKYVELALVIDIKQFGSHHPTVAVDYNALGICWQELKDNYQAIGCYEKAFKIILQASGSFHPQLATYYNNLGLSWYEFKEYDKAEYFLKKALEINISFYGLFSHRVSANYSNLGQTLIHLDNLEDALELVKSGLAIDQKLFGEKHPNVISGYYFLGVVYENQGNSNIAVKYYEKSLGISETLYGTEYLANEKIINQLIPLYDDLGEEQKVLSYFKKRLKLDIKKHGIFHGGVAIDLSSIGACYSDLNLIKAIQYTESAVFILKKVFGDEDSTTKSIKKSFKYLLARLADKDQYYGENLKYLKKIGLKEFKHTLKYFIFREYQLYLGLVRPLLIALLPINSYLFDLHPKTAFRLIMKNLNRLSLNAYLYLDYDKRQVFEEVTQPGISRKKIGTEQEANASIFILLEHTYKELNQFERAKAAYQNAIQYYQPTTEHPTYTLAEKYLQNCQQKLNEVKQEVSPKTEIDLTKENDEELSEAIALSLNIPQKEEVSTNYSSATLLTQHSAIYGSGHQVSPTTSQSTAAVEKRAHSPVAEEEDLELEEAFRLSLENK